MEVSIITQNMFQVPWPVVSYYSKFRKDVPIDECRDQTERAKRAVMKLSQYDICVMQEMWGSSSHIIRNGLINSHEFPSHLSDFISNGFSMFGVRNISADHINTARTYLRKTGGLLFASCRDMPIVWYRHHILQSNNEERSHNKSLGITLLDMSRRWGAGKYLLVCNVHYYSPGPFKTSSLRRNQRDETRKVFESLHEQPIFPVGFQWENCGIVFAGDFNVAHVTIDYNGHMEVTNEYQDLINSFTPLGSPMRNLCEEHDPSLEYLRNPTFSRHNSYVPRRCHSEASTIDYVFVLDHFPKPNDFGPPEYVKTLPLEATSAKAHTQNQNQEYSDHYPIIAKIRIKGTTSPSTSAGHNPL